MQSVPVPLLSSLINIHNHGSNFLLHSHSQTPLSSTSNAKSLPKEAPKYNDNAISTELECFIHKSSSSGSIGVDGDELDDMELSSADSDDEYDGMTSHSKKAQIELMTKSKNDPDRDLERGSVSKSHHKHSHHKSHHHHHHHHRRRKGHCNVMPQWVLYLSSLDKLFSSKIHRLSCGSIDYLFVFGAFVFGSKFMPITILLSIFLVDVPGFIYLLLSCTITVSITQFGKRLFGRHRPDPKQLASKRLDFRTRLTNYSFPSGDTAQAAAYSTSLWLLTQNVWLLLLIPNCAWSRVYFGCHWICDCIIGAAVGCFIPLFIWSMIPQETFIDTQQTIVNWMH